MLRNKRVPRTDRYGHGHNYCLESAHTTLWVTKPKQRQWFRSFLSFCFKKNHMSLTSLRILSGDLWTKEQPSASFWCAMEQWNGVCAVSWKKTRHSCSTSSWIWVWIWKARICLSFVCHARPFRGQRDHVESHFAMTLEQLDSKTFNS